VVARRLPPFFLQPWRGMRRPRSRDSLGYGGWHKSSASNGGISSYHANGLLPYQRRPANLGALGFGLGEEAACRVSNDRFVLWARTLVALAVIGLAAYVVTRQAPGQPAVTVLTGIAAVLAAIPPILKALRGR
jgi:hypothetical protein